MHFKNPTLERQNKHYTAHAIVKLKVKKDKKPNNWFETKAMPLKKKARRCSSGAVPDVFYNKKEKLENRWDPKTQRLEYTTDDILGSAIGPGFLTYPPGHI